MRKLITVLSLIVSLSIFSQDVKFEKIEIFHPFSGKKLETLKDHKALFIKLDSLNSIYKTDVFGVIKHLPNSKGKYYCKYKLKTKSKDTNLYRI